jgi:TolB-like protein/DNA-binding winged helix-turn-helix (wHTH) protein
LRPKCEFDENLSAIEKRLNQNQARFVHSRRWWAMAECSGLRGKVRFGIFEADLDAGELRKNGARIHLQEQPFHVLSVLLERPGQLVSREDICRQVWGERTFVEFDHALNTAIKKIRIAIGDDAATPRYIETVPKRGYRFIAPIQAQQDVSASPVANVVLSGSTSSRLKPMFFGAVGMTVILAGIGAILLRGPGGSDARGARRILLAVLPFENASGDVAQESLCDGLTQEVIMQLGHSDPSRLWVAARSKVLPYRNTTKPVSQIGRELGADYLMEGNLRRDGARVRVTAELIRARDEARLWGEEFDGVEDAGVLAVETELAREIAAKIQSEALLAVQ